MEEAANDPRQAKVRKFFQSSSVISTKNQNEDSAECEDATVNEATNQPVISQGESTIYNELVIATSSGTGYVAEKFNESDPVNSTSMNISNEKVYRPATTSVLPTGSTPKIFEFENDKGLYDNASGTSLNVDQIRALLLTGPCQPRECDMPGEEFKQSSDKRRFFKRTLHFITNKKLYLLFHQQKIILIVTTVGYLAMKLRKKHLVHWFHRLETLSSIGHTTWFK